MKEIEYTEVGDEYRGFIESKMHEIDPMIYNDDDFDLYFNNEHINVFAFNDKGRVLAFACLLVMDNGFKMCYTYACADGTRAYAKGIDYVVARYSPVLLSHGALKLNKIQRMLQ